MSNKESVFEYVKGSTLLTISSFLSKLIGFVFLFVAARYFGPERYGIITIGFMVVGLGSTMALMGLQTALKRFTGEFRADSEEKAASLISKIFIYILVSSGVIAVSINIFSHDVIGILGSSLFADYLFLFSLAIPLSSLIILFENLFLGVNKPVYASVYKLIGKKGLFSLLSLCVVILLGLSLSYFVELLIFSFLLSIMAGFFLLKREMDVILSISHNVDRTRIFRFSLPLFFSSSIGLILGWSDTFFISHYLQETSVGIYSSAYKLATSLGVFVSSFGSIFVSKASQGQEIIDEDISERFNQIQKIILLLVGPIFLYFSLFPSKIMSLIFGNEYSTGGSSLVIVSTGYLLLSLVGVTTELFQLYENTNILLKFNALGAGVNLILNFILIPRMGIEGAAIAFAIGLASVNLSLYVVAKRKIGIGQSPKFYLKYLVALAVSTLVAYLLTYSLADLLRLLVFPILFGTTYIVMIYRTKLAYKEIKMLYKELENYSKSL